MASQKLSHEVTIIGQKLLNKIQKLPQADHIEIISFAVILLFIFTVLLMAVLACSYCCCDFSKKRLRVLPEGEV
uniref:Small integral membrane protein 5 n=1 Tax=Geotrypetes seraphini TaxID=260995 RepID=A0A6P8SHF6_GEOSA|nr:small integral membrane protein 5 [Geotrypetes seraphini]